MTVLPLDVTKQSFLINADQLGLNYKDTLFVEWSLQSVPIKDNVRDSWRTWHWRLYQWRNMMYISLSNRHRV